MPLDANSIPPLIGSGWFWDSPEGEKLKAEMSADQQAKIDEAAQDVLDAFTTPAGRRVWERLWREVVMNPSFTDAQGLLQGIATGFAREGQRALIMTLHRQMEHAQNVRLGGNDGT